MFMKKIMIALLAAAITAMAAVGVSAAETNAAYDAPTVGVEGQKEAEDFNGPRITGFENTADGTTLRWTAYPNAVRYRVFLWDGETWRGLDNTGSLSYTHKGLTSGQSYRYTVRALNREGDFISDYWKAGDANVFLAPPVIRSLENTEQGVQVSWDAVEGAAQYRVYRKTAETGWKRVADTAQTDYLDMTAPSGETVSYTVRCITADGSDWTSYYNDGKSIAYVATPYITSYENTADGTLLHWGRCAGAARYGVFYKNAEGNWKGIGTSATNSYLNKNVKTGESTVYTVRCLDSDGEFVSRFHHEGWSCLFLEPPVIRSLENTGNGVQVTWNALAGAEKYRVYRKTDGESWKRIGDTAETTLLDPNAPSGVTVSYTVRCINADGSDWTSYYNSGKSIRFVKTPKVTGFENTAEGTVIRWEPCNGAARYGVFYKNAEGNWKGLGTSKTTEYLNTAVKSGEPVVYTVRCLDSDGEFISQFNREGWSYTFLEPPVISSLKSTENGVQVRWNALKGAEKYRVYRKADGESWKRIGDTAETSFLDANAPPGKKLSYTVRCINADGSDWTSYYNSGKSIKYVKTPKITGFENTDSGAKLSFTKCDGAARYGIFYLSADGWKGLRSTSDTFFLDTTVKNGETRTYTVRCLDSDYEFVSDFNSTGWTNRYFAPPQIASVAQSGSGNLVKWNAVDGADSYRLYRKKLGGGWARLFDSTKETSYQDDSAQKNELYAYTLRLMDKNGALISSYIDDAKFYYNGRIADGKVTVGGNTYNFNNGKLRQGYVTIDGATYYFTSSGEMLKDCLVGSSAEGFRYAGKDGKIDYHYTGIAKNAYGSWYVENGVFSFDVRKAVTWGGSDWNILDGRATKVTTEYDETLNRAFKLVDKVCDSNMSKADKLWKMFRYIQGAYTEMNPRIPHYHGDGWEILYANDMLVYGKGNCISYGAEFAFIAKAIGYNETYACQSGGHGWAEVEGKVYDPEWGRHRFKYTYFGIDYDNNPTEVDYKGGIAAGYPWMHVKI